MLCVVLPLLQVYPVPVLAINVVFPPMQIPTLGGVTVAVGLALTVTVVVAVAVHPPVNETVTL